MSVTPQSLIDLLPEAVLLVGRDGIIVGSNRSLERLTGTPHGALHGQPLTAVLVAADEDLATYLTHCSGAMQPVPGVVSLLAAPDKPLRAFGAATLTEEGEPGPLLLRLVPQKEATAPFSLLTQRVQQLSAEILHRQRIEEDLRLTEGRLRLAIDVAEMGSWEFDPATGVVDCSARCRALLDLPGDGPVAYEDFLARIEVADRPRVNAAIEAASVSADQSGFAVDYRLVRNDGRPSRWLSHRGRALAQQGRPFCLIGMVLDVSEVRQAAEAQRLLIDELNHRVKNSLATVQSIAVQTIRHSEGLHAFHRDFEARLMALSETHNLLNRSKWQGASLRDVLELEFAPYQDPAGGRLRAAGPMVHLPSQSVISLGLAFHELATNAVKYGALSRTEGYVVVEWAVVPAKAGPRLRLHWSETGGPPVVPPQRRGFGSRLIERAFTYELGGRVDIRFAPAGLECDAEMALPAPAD